MKRLDEYLQRYGGLLSRKCQESLRPLHTPKQARHRRLADLLRQPFEAQAHVITAAAKHLKRHKSLLMVCEMGTGKTLLSIATVHCQANEKPYRAIVMAPGQLARKWAREITETLPNVEVYQVGSIADVKHITGKPTKPAWYIVSREKAKLGPAWRPAVAQRYAKGLPLGTAACPRCGSKVADKDGKLIEPDKLAKKQHFCIQCGEALWQWTDKPRRWPVATYIHKRLTGAFDYAIIDEAHEEKSAESAQAHALGSLAAAARRTICLTGTLLGGYANHVRPLLFRLAPRSLLHAGLGWGDHVAFVEKYGRLDTIIRETERDETANNRQSRGSSTTKRRVERPGVMPTLFGSHLIDKCVFLRLEEIAANLPAYTEKVIPVEMSGDLTAAYEEVESDMGGAMRDLIKNNDRRLLGAFLESTLYYADTPYDWKPQGYWEKGEGGGDGCFITVCIPPALSKEAVYPKEQALIKLLKEERQQGRQCWVYVQRERVQERLRAILDAAGLKVGVLHSSVDLVKREEWIVKNGKEVEVMLSHPKLVETGLDLFDKNGGHNFVTLVWYETGYQLFTLRQASRRSWRIGQTQPCRVFYLYYRGTMQERAMALMGKKLVAAEAIDGKFSTEGLVACAGDDGNLEMALARSLMDRIEEDAARTWQRLGEEPATLPFKNINSTTLRQRVLLLKERLARKGA